MLSRSSRLTSPADFQTALRRGRRAGSRSLVVHLAVPGTPSATAPVEDRHGLPPRAGLVVSRAVGNATVRNRVKRRLRHLCREVLPVLQEGALLVVRALPPAASATYAELDDDLRRSLDRVREVGVSR